MRAFFHRAFRVPALLVLFFAVTWGAMIFSTAYSAVIVYNGSLAVPSGGSLTTAAGSSTNFGTGITANGVITSSVNTSGSDFLHLGSTYCQTGPLTFSYSTFASVAGVNPNAYGNYCGTNGWIFAMDYAGDIGTLGGVYAGSYYSSNNPFRVGVGAAPSNGDFVAGLTSTGEGNPYIGCAGTAQTCTFRVYSAGTGSSPTFSIDASGNATANGYLTSVAGAAISCAVGSGACANGIDALVSTSGTITTGSSGCSVGALCGTLSTGLHNAACYGGAGISGSSTSLVGTSVSEYFTYSSVSNQYSADLQFVNSPGTNGALPANTTYTIFYTCL